MNIFKKMFGGKSKKISNFNDFLLFASSYKYNANLDEFLATAYMNPFISSAFENLIRAMQNLDWGTFKKGYKDNLKETKLTVVSNTLKRPSALTNQDEFMNYLMLYYLLDGECLIRRIPMANKYDLMLYKKNTYNYRVLDMANTKELRVNGVDIPESEQEDYYVFKNINLYSYIAGTGEGRSTLESLALLHDFYCLIMTWNNDSLKNDGNNPYAIKSDVGLSDEQKKELIDKYVKKSRSKGLPLILEDQGLEIVSLPTRAPKDFDYLSALDEIRNMTASVLGVPSILIGDRTNQKFSNYKEAKKALYTETILPVAERIKQTLNDFLYDWLEPNEEISYITDRIEVLKEDTNEKIKLLSGLSGILTINELRGEIGYEPVENGDDVLVDPMKTPLNMINEQPEPYSEDVTDGVDYEKEKDK